MPFAIAALPDAHETQSRPRLGRREAGAGFLGAVARAAHAGAEPVVGYGLPDEQAGFTALVTRFAPAARVGWIDRRRPEALAAVGALVWPSPLFADEAFRRDRFAPGGWSLIGTTHTLSGRRVLDGLAALVTAPVEPYDALVCTSRAARAVVERVFAVEEERLSARLGAVRFTRPALPVIPLGVEPNVFARDPVARAAMRASLGVGDDAVVALAFGRLDARTKAHPVPLLVAAARARPAPTLLVIAGAGPDPDAGERLARLARTFAPDLPVVVAADPDDTAKADLFRAADLFVSLADNVQETFGLAVLEAMAAGLPCVVSDWDGYRDTVRHGTDGFLVPTSVPPSALGVRLADLHACGAVGHADYVGETALRTVVDVDAAAGAIAALVSDADLRGRFGASGAARVAEHFAWSRVLAQIRSLCGELSEIRRASRAPARPLPRAACLSPFDLFAGHATHAVGPQTRVTLRDERLADVVTADETYRFASGAAEAHAAVAAIAAGAETLAQVQDALADRDLDRGRVATLVLALAKAGVLALSRD